MPLFVISSPGVGRTTTRSPSGRSFFVLGLTTACAVDFEAWFLLKVRSADRVPGLRPARTPSEPAENAIRLDKYLCETVL
jgi:hypothetical protein